MNWTCVLALFLSLQLHLTPSSEAAFNVSLELQGDCSDQLTLICRHSDDGSPPVWIHNGTAESGQLLVTAFPGAVYTVLTRTEHTTTITGVDNVRNLDGYVFQCAYEDLGNLIKSNAVTFSFIPPDYRPALSLVNFTSNFSERLSTFTYSYQESCSLYPRCTPYFSVEYTVSPQSAVSISSSGCSVEYTIHNLMRCVSYQSTATALINNQRGNLVVVGDTVMLRPGQFTITDVSIGADRNLINVTYMENEPDCPGYPTERYTVDVDGVQVADLTADAVQSLAINPANGSVTLFLPLSQPLPENALTLNMTKYNTVPTNRSDNMGNIVTDMMALGTSAVFALRESPPGGESPSAVNDEIVIAVSVPVGVLVTIAGGGVIVIIISVIAQRDKKKKEAACIRCLQACIRCPQACIRCLQACFQCLQACIRCLLCFPCLLQLTVRKRKKKEEEDMPGSTHDQTPIAMDDHKLVTGAGRQLQVLSREEVSHAAHHQYYAELDFADRRPFPAPKSDMFVVAYAEVGQA